MGHNNVNWKLRLGIVVGQKTESDWNISQRVRNRGSDLWELSAPSWDRQCCIWIFHNMLQAVPPGTSPPISRRRRRFSPPKNSWNEGNKNAASEGKILVIVTRGGNINYWARFLSNYRTDGRNQLTESQTLTEWLTGGWTDWPTG